MSDEAPLPLRHRSTVRLGEPLACAEQHAVENETPLFAADLEFALAHGGALTRAFLQALPLDPGDAVVVDSSLVWLSPGLLHGFVASGPLAGPRAKLGFVHEPFPGIATGVRGEANRNRQATHWLAVFGLDCTPELAAGEVVLDAPDQAESFWLPTDSLEFREQRIAQLLEAGQLQLQPLPVATVVEFGWGMLLRSRPATTHGFQFVIRATRGDRRPHVNGLRNLAQL